MSERIYPRAVSKPEPTPIDEEACIAAIIEAREAGRPKAEAIGDILKACGQSDDVPGFERCWRTVDAEVAAAKGCLPNDKANENAYRAALAQVAPHLDAKKWVDGLKAQMGAASFDVLKAKFNAEL